MQLISVGKDANGNFQSTIGTKYERGERVYQGPVNSPTARGTVIDYNEVNQTIRVNPVVGEFVVDTPLFGYLSATRSIPKTVNTPSLSAVVNAITQISGLFSDDLANSSTSSQKIQDSYFAKTSHTLSDHKFLYLNGEKLSKNPPTLQDSLVFAEVIVDSSASVSTVPLGGSTTCPSTTT